MESMLQDSCSIAETTLVVSSSILVCSFSSCEIMGLICLWMSNLSCRFASSKLGRCFGILCDSLGRVRSAPIKMRTAAPTPINNPSLFLGNALKKVFVIPSTRGDSCVVISLLRLILGRLSLMSRSTDIDLRSCPYLFALFFMFVSRCSPIPLISFVSSSLCLLMMSDRACSFPVSDRTLSSINPLILLHSLL